LLPDSQLLQSWFPESFILYLPKDVVSGDFYWLVSDDDKLFVAAVDCTGHGVPGAFMSVLGHTLLSQIVTQQKIHQPSAILQELHRQTVLQLQQQEDAANIRKDGMDLALTVIDKKTGTLTYSGAKRPLVYMDSEGLQIIKGDRFSIGDRPRTFEGDDLPFRDHVLPIEEVKQIFLFSDG
ncbi:MAG: SpoIIE family protein phosphatase, partial [Bacteroidota bacterium]